MAWPQSIRARRACAMPTAISGPIERECEREAAAHRVAAPHSRAASIAECTHRVGPRVAFRHLDRGNLVAMAQVRAHAVPTRRRLREAGHEHESHPPMFTGLRW